LILLYEEMAPWQNAENAGTFASAAGGGCSEQKGVAAAPLAGRRETGPGTAMRQQEASENARMVAGKNATQQATIL